MVHQENQEVAESKGGSEAPPQLVQPIPRPDVARHAAVGALIDQRTRKHVHKAGEEQHATDLGDTLISIR